MTIRATAALLLGTLAITAGATNDNLRGKNNKNNNNEVESRERVLIDMDMNMGLGEMVCKERVPIDGSVICTFRTMPPADMMTANVHHDCLYNSRTRTNFCLGMEVYRASFSDLPDATVVQQPVIPIQQRPVQQQPSVQPNPAVGFVGSCPSVPQATGMLCYQYVPVGSREVSCYFGRTQCNCALNDDPSVAEQWQCRPIPEDSFVGGGGGVVQTEPPPAPVQEEQEPPPVVTRPVVPNPAVTVVDTNPVTNIDAMVVSPNRHRPRKPRRGSPFDAIALHSIRFDSALDSHTLFFVFGSFLRSFVPSFEFSSKTKW